MNEQEAKDLTQKYSEATQEERNLEKIKPNYMNYDYWKEFNDRLVTEVQPDVMLSLVFTNLATKKHTFFHNYEGRLNEEHKDTINDLFSRCHNKEYMFNHSVFAVIFDPTKVPVFEKLKQDYFIQDLRFK